MVQKIAVRTNFCKFVTHVNSSLFNFLVASSSSSLSSKYDPDLLRAEIEIARQRVTKLKMEEHYARHDLRGKQRGIQTLARFAKYFSLVFLFVYEKFQSSRIFQN